MVACKVARGAASCAESPSLLAPASPRWCSPPATAAAESLALTRASVSAAPKSCVCAAASIPPLRSLRASGSDAARVLGPDSAAPPALPAGTAAASNNRSPAQCRTSHTMLSSCTAHVHAPTQTAFFYPSHCSLSRASCFSTRPVKLQCQECPRSAPQKLAQRVSAGYLV